MRIGVNLLYLIPGVVGGTQTYGIGLLHGFDTIDSDDEFVLYMNRELARDADRLGLPRSKRFRHVTLPVNATRRGARYAWEQLALPIVARAQKIDVLHSLGYVGPVRTPCPHVVSIHDMNYLDIPQSVPGLRQRVLASLVRRAATHADRVITMSEYSRARIIHHLGLAPERVIVTHLAGRDEKPAENVASDVTARHRITTPYIVAFSSPFPHKNITRLIEAFALVKDEFAHQLVLIGHMPPDGAVAAAIAAQNLEHRVRITGYVPDADVLPLIGGAHLFAFPSVYEGFGLPLLDAQRMGVPIVASSAASIPEVAGDGALYFDPLDSSGMADAIRSVLSQKSVAETLSFRGVENAKRFTWQQTARDTLAVYRGLAGN